MTSKDKKKKSFNEYQIFHINRIMNVLMEAEFPANTNGTHMEKVVRVALLIGWKEPRERTIRSMFELSYFSYDEFDKIKEIFDIEG